MENNYILQPGTLLKSRYRVIEILGAGSYGTVYKAADSHFSNYPCAVKVTYTAHPEQFAKEAHLLRGLHHANIPRVMDLDYDPEVRVLFLVMDYITGPDLSQELIQRGEPFEEAQIANWLVQLLDTLTYIHNQNPPIIHRDIKPNNLKVTPQGRVMLLDFGIAHQRQPGQFTTSAGGTPRYMPIEQYAPQWLTHSPRILNYLHNLRQQGIHTGAYSDLYALAATAYHFLAGESPPEAHARMQLNQQLPPIRAFNPRVSVPMEQALRIALAIDPTQRYQSAAEMKQDLFPATQATDVNRQVRAYINMGTSALNAGDLNGAVKYLEQALQLDPDNTKAQRMLTLALQKRQSTPSSPYPAAPLSRFQELMQRGQTAFNSQQYTEAIRYFEAALDEDPDNQNAMQWLTAARKRRKQHK